MVTSTAANAFIPHFSWAAARLRTNFSSAARGWSLQKPIGVSLQAHREAVSEPCRSLILFEKALSLSAEFEGRLRLRSEDTKPAGGSMVRVGGAGMLGGVRAT